MAGNYARYNGLSVSGGSGGSGVSSLNSLTGALTLVAGAGITITPSGSNITITNSQSITTGNLTDVGTDGITVTGGTGAVIGSGTSISQHVADTTHNGYLSSTDWNTFNGKGSGTLTAVSIASANGFAGSSSGGATPALTLSTSITGIIKGNGTAISAATSGTDYSLGTSALGTGILKSTTSTGALTIAVAGDFPTLNQNTSGTAAGLSATLGTGSGGTGVTSVTTSPTASAFAGWDANKNLSANAMIEGFTTTATAAGTTTMTIANTYLQYWTGSTTQTVKLPTTSVVAGQQYLITNLSTGVVTVQSSAANTIQALAASTVGLFTALVATPTTAANWDVTYYAHGTVPVALGGTGQTSVISSPAATAWAGWDANKNLSATNHIEGFTTTATAAGTTTLVVGSTYQQYFTGVTTQTVKLPTTSIVAGQQYSITNQSTGNVTVQSSAANTIQILSPGVTSTFTALVATPTTAANWIASSIGAIAASYYASANGTSSSTQSVNFDTKVYDSANAVTASAAGTGTWTFTAPVAGYYHVQGFYIATTQHYWDIYKNGVKFASIGTSEISADSCSTSYDIQLAASDTIDIRADSSVTYVGGLITAQAGASKIQIYLIR
jgi:hypothetical protein